MIASRQESYDKPRHHVEKQRHHFADKGTYSQGYGLPSGHVQLWELNHEEGRAPKTWCLWTVVLEKTLEGPLDSKETKSVNLPWKFIRRTDAEAPIYWSPHVNSQLLMLGKIEGQRRKGRQKIRWLDDISDAMDMNLGKHGEMVTDSEAWRAAVHGDKKSRTWLGGWTTTTTSVLFSYCKVNTVPWNKFNC